MAVLSLAQKYWKNPYHYFSLDLEVPLQMKYFIFSFGHKTLDNSADPKTYLSEFSAICK